MNCNFELMEELPDGRRRWRCKVCGQKTAPTGSRVELIIFRCKAGPKDAKSLARRYAMSTVRWMGAGKPLRTQKEVGFIFSTFCEPCDHFNDVRKVCRLCGCRVAPTTKGLVNKIARATSRCPDDPPRWIESEGYRKSS